MCWGMLRGWDYELAPMKPRRKTYTKPDTHTKTQHTVNNAKRGKEMGSQTTWPASCKTCVQVKKQQLEPDMEQQTGSKSGRGTSRLYCHPAYLTSRERISCEMPGWMKHKLESRLLGEISVTPETQTTPPLWQKVKKNQRTHCWKWKRRVKKLA